MVNSQNNHRNTPQLRLPPPILLLSPFYCVWDSFFFFFASSSCYCRVPSGLPELPEGFFHTLSLLLNNTMVNNVWKKWKKQIIPTGSEHGADAALLGNSSRQGTKTKRHTSHMCSNSTNSQARSLTNDVNKARKKKTISTHAHTLAQCAVWCCNYMSLPRGQSNHLKEKYPEWWKEHGGDVYDEATSCIASLTRGRWKIDLTPQPIISQIAQNLHIEKKIMETSKLEVDGWGRGPPTWPVPFKWKWHVMFRWRRHNILQVIEEIQQQTNKQAKENVILATLVGCRLQELWLIHNGKTCKSKIYFLESSGLSLLFCK